MAGSFVLHTDGAARGNPGPAGIGAVLYRREGTRVVEVARVSEAIGTATNNVAEYRAVLAGLALAAAERPDHLVLRADSQLLVRQLQGRYAVRARHLIPLHHEVRTRLAGFPRVTVEHVARERNRVADRLANAALDR
jgi:ribonuclease HI